MKKEEKKIVYVALSADILHEGHINILKKAANLGEVTVGLLTDKAISSYKKVPYLNYKQRELISKYINIKIVNNSIKIYKYLRVFTINENDIDKTLYIIKITVSIDLCKTPENIYINFKICKLKNIINKLTI